MNRRHRSLIVTDQRGASERLGGNALVFVDFELNPDPRVARRAGVNPLRDCALTADDLFDAQWSAAAGDRIRN
jgi:hypothetical protein